GAASITTTALASSLNPAAAGADVTFTATVTGTSPTGTVTLKDGAATLGTGTLNVSYQAAYSTSSLTAGTHSITAVYGGDSINSGSTSSAVNQVINTVSTISASLNLPHLTDSGACSQSGNFCDNPLPLFTLDGKFATAADAAFAIPVFTSAGSVGGSNLSYALITGFSLLINGSLIGGVGASGKFELPVFTVISKMAATAALKLPLFKTDVEYLTGRIADTRMLRLPRLKIVTLVFNPPIIHGATGFPVIGISASALTGGCCDFDATLPAIKMPSLPYANAYAGGVSRAAALTPAFLASAAGYGQYKGSAAVAMAVFAVESMMSFVETTNTRVIVLNINTGAVTEYTGYDFNGFCQWGDGYFAEGDSGIYILGGQTDDGSPINCRIKTSKTQLKNARGGGESSIKHIPAVYAVVKTPQPYVFKAVTDDGIEHVYQPEATEAARSEGTTPRKIKLGKGMKGRYWQFAIETTAGAPLEIESFEPEVAATSRRV
ncbi:MAG: Ig-like domain repeat protein, partial [Nitrospirae bacterium]|nr:Ig-like domain repeat protein [Nitrospirota bacterium]